MNPIHSIAPLCFNILFASFFVSRIEGMQGIYNPSPLSALREKVSVLAFVILIHTNHFNSEITCAAAKNIHEG